MTAADKRAPSAFPAAITVAAFITRPICFMLGRCPSSSATSAMAVSATSASSLGERRREVLVNDPCLGMLGGGELTAAVLGVDLRRLTTLARFPGQHLDHLVVGELSCLLARDLLGLDRGQQHAYGRGPQLVLRLHRLGQV